MGDVYRAEHRLMNRDVAIKVINPKLVSNATAVARFQREVQAAAQLSHPNIVTSYDAEQTGNLHFLVMEYIEGADLASVVRDRGPLAVDVACEWTAQAACGLQHAHEHGMVHRDIKPHNLRVSPQGIIKILDFGLATISSRPEDLSSFETDGTDEDSSDSRAHLTKTGVAMGTPDFVSPEQVADPKLTDARSDIYSLGCTLYYMLTGVPPFRDGSVIDKLQAHQTLNPEPIHVLRDDIPASLSTIINRMLAKNPEDRFQSADDVVAALAPWNHRAQKHTTAKRFTLWNSWVAMIGVITLLLGAFLIMQPQDNSNANHQGQVSQDNAKDFSSGNPKRSHPASAKYEISQDSAYKVSEGRFLQWISPEKTLERPSGPHHNSNGQIYVQDGKALRLKQSGVGEPTSLHSVALSLLRVFPCEMAGDGAIWTKQIPGDFVVRKGASQEQIVTELNRILREQMKLGASLNWTEEEADVWIVRGKFQAKPMGEQWRRPEPEDMAYVLFGRSKEGLFESNAGSFDELLKAFGSRTGRPVINQLKESPSGIFGWQSFTDQPDHTNWSQFPRHLAKNVDLVAKHFAEQTGLMIISDRQRVRLLNASGPADADRLLGTWQRMSKNLETELLIIARDPDKDELTLSFVDNARNTQKGRLHLQADKQKFSVVITEDNRTTREWFGVYKFDGARLTWEFTSVNLRETNRAVESEIDWQKILKENTSPRMPKGWYFLKSSS